MICFVLIGCGTAEEFTESEETNTEVSSEILDDESIEDDYVDLNSAGAGQTELEEQKMEIIENELKLKFQREANNITHLYVTAQQLFYNGNSEQALILIQQANEIRDNADIKALKGSIYLSLGYRDKFEQNWRQAFELDKDVPIPAIPYIKQELKNLGLID